MQSSWIIEYCETDDASSVERWLAQRTKEQFKGIAKEMLLLQRCGNTLRLPHSKALGQGLFELKEKQYGYRIYYTFLKGQRVIMLHAGDKSTQKKDIKIARERLLAMQQYSKQPQEYPM